MTSSTDEISGAVVSTREQYHPQRRQGTKHSHHFRWKNQAGRFRLVSNFVFILVYCRIENNCAGNENVETEKYLG